MECYKDDAEDDEQKELEEETIIKDVYEAIQVQLLENLILTYSFV